MKNRTMLWGTLFALLILTSGCIAQGYDPALVAQLVQIQEATKGFQTMQAAETAGYAQFMDCTHEPEEGAMGIHFVNGDLVGDTVLDLALPEAVLYEPAGDEPNLTGVEYIVFAEAWQAEHSDPPTLMGQPFKFVDSPNRYDLPPFYALHVWVWKTNPKGLFADWNPAVTCPNDSTSAHHNHANPQ
jgi:hypothetical protein